MKYENKPAFHEAREMLLPDHTETHPSRLYLVHIVRRVDLVSPLVFVFDLFGWAVDDSRTVGAAKEIAQKG
jgi:hypothetical protein